MPDWKQSDQTLQDDNNILQRERMQPDRHVTRSRRVSADLSNTDGPFAETKEHLGGILVLDSED